MIRDYSNEEMLAGLREKVSYDPETGAFTWLVSGRGRFQRKGMRAGTLKGRYQRIHVRPFGDLYLHRAAWLMQTGKMPGPGMEIDHINGDRLDNRFCNLRVATIAQNRHNTVGQPKARKYVEYKGVCRSAGGTDRSHVEGSKRKFRWKARLMVNGVTIHLGIYDTQEEAAQAYLEGSKKYHGEFSIARRDNL